ncbi:MAG: YdbH domain-containing protein [Pseudohongiella sp.]|nr:YdbH domain-containing protein [Pseudohongiella sp.]
MKNATSNQRKPYLWLLSLLVLATLTLGAALAFQQKDTLVLRVANQLLRTYDIQITSIEGIRFSLQSFSAETIEMQIPQSPVAQTIRNIQLQFDPFELLGGRINSLTAEQATLSVPLLDNHEGLNATINKLDITCQNAQLCSGSALLQMDVGALTDEDTGFQSSTSHISSSVDFSYQAGQLGLTLPPGMHISLESARYGNFRLQQIELISSQAWKLELNPADQSFSLSAGMTSLAFNTTDTMNSRVSINDIHGSCSGLDRCDASAHVDVRLTSYQSPDSLLEIAGLGFASNVELRYQARNLNVTLPADLEFSMESGRYTGYRIEQLEAISQEPWEFEIDLDALQASLSAKSTELKLPVIRTRTDSETPSLSGLTLHLQQLDMRFDLSTTQSRPWHQQLSGSAELDISQVYTTLAAYNFWPYQWNTHVQWLNADQLLIDLFAKHSENQLFSIKLDHSINNKQGKANFKLEELNFSPSGARLSSYVSPLPFDADLLDGSVALEGNVTWHTDPASDIWQPEGQIQLELRKLAGFMDEIVFSGLEANSAWSLRPDYSITTQSAFVLNIREIDPGIPLFNVQSSVSVDSASGLIHLRSPHAEVFGGTVSTDRIDLFLPQENRADELGETFNIAIEAIDVAQVLSLSAYEQVSATGIISGVLPVRFKGLKPVIEAGQLSASQQGGSIRYDQGGIASGNQNLDLVYQALEHYQYDSLSAGVDFDEHGELNLALQMRGQSPNVGQGQRINLNLNISDNIPALLQSLQAADNMAERLQDMLE